MSSPANEKVVIRVNGLGKKYRIGASQPKYDTLQDAIVRSAVKPFRKLSRLGRSGTPSEAFWAIRDLSFEVQRGDVLGIIGRNGAGKSTLLKILSRITEPTTGQAEVWGRIGSLLEVGTGFHPELTGRENIFLNGSILGMTRKEIRTSFDQIVSFAEVDRFLDTPVKHYSSGMYVRLAFAVAAHLRTEILFVDEVLAVGDAQFQNKCLGKMAEVAGQGRTVLFVSHNMAAVEMLCGKVLLLTDGTCGGIGPSAELVPVYLKNCAVQSRERLMSGQTRCIRSVASFNAQGVATSSFAAGEDIRFDIELYAKERITYPRLSIGIHTTWGVRLVTIHTDIQNNHPWPFEGTRRLRALWRGNRMVPGRYRVDVAIWGPDREIETLPGCLELEIAVADVYGTGALPDPSFQGYFLADASWDI